MSIVNDTQDPLKKLFSQLPGETLPKSFRSTMMQQIMAEAVRMKKRNERLAFFAVVAASLLMATLGVSVFIYLDVPMPRLSWPDMPSFASARFYLFIGVLTLLLLFGDYQLRKIFWRKHNK